ncbi:MAG: Gfo/Idh/MocA family oxidoreductase [Thermoanaerobaculia bacterium]|nr:Gfo/Idh/MocA family oxidoreductase [Thermoanaerobaculia bacterium]
MKNFAVVGVGGYIAPRHLRAIRDTGNRLAAATDPSDSVGILDQFSFDVRYFREIERFDRHLDKLRRGRDDSRIEWVSICSPNYLHDAHIRLALRNGANVICEKPLVINPWNLDALAALEAETGRTIATVLQLRVHPALIELKARLDAERRIARRDVVLTYVTSRGPWYHASWKGTEERSGGVGTNIGIHFFDLLLWLFGKPQLSEVHLRDPRRMSGLLELSGASVRWFLSVDSADLPASATAEGRSTFRSITVDGAAMEFTEGFADLHTRVYEKTLAGEGHGIEDARPSIELVHALRTVPIGGDGPRHPAAARSFE